MNSEITVTFPKEVTLNFKLFGGDTNVVEHTVKSGKKATTHSWKVKNFPAMDFENSAPPLSTISPHLIISVESYFYKGSKINVLEQICIIPLSILYIYIYIYINLSSFF